MTYTYTVHDMNTGGGVWVARKVVCVFPRFHRVCVYLIEYVCIQYVCMASRCAAVNKGAKGGGVCVARADGCGGLHASEKLGDAMAGREREGGGEKSCDWKRKPGTCGTRSVGLIGQRLRPSITPATTRGRGRRDKALSRILGGIEVRARLCGNSCGQARVRFRVYSIRASFVLSRAPCTHALPPQQHPCGAPSPYTSPPGTHCSS